MGSSNALANLKWANLSASFGARRMAGNDIGIGLVLTAGCSPVPKVVSEIAEAIVSVCGRERFTEVEMRGGPLHEADLEGDAQRISGLIAVNLTPS